MEFKKNKVFVQIGTNDGKDHFNFLVRKYKPSRVILVEPNKRLIRKIKVNYRFIPNVFLESVAITAYKQDTAKLVIPECNTSDTEYSDNHFTLVPMDTWGSDFISIDARAMTFNQLCRKHNIKHIHYLEIDTEGYDSEIIRSIDFKKITIDIIQYENWGFDNSCFTSYGDKSVNYGIQGMERTKQQLESLGYILTSDGGNIIAEKK